MGCRMPRRLQLHVDGAQLRFYPIGERAIARVSRERDDVPGIARNHRWAEPRLRRGERFEHRDGFVRGIRPCKSCCGTKRD